MELIPLNRMEIKRGFDYGYMYVNTKSKAG